MTPTKPTSPSVGLLLLAAGGSSRLGHPKQLVPFQGRTLLRHAAETATTSHCSPIVVVLGARAGDMRAALANLPVTIIENENWQQGIGSSIACGVRHIASTNNLQALVIMLCDQPLVSAPLINNLIQTYTTSGQKIVASAYGGTSGPPALFDASLFAALTLLPSTQGAKAIMQRHAHEMATVVFDGGEIDLDTPEDLQRLNT